MFSLDGNNSGKTVLNNHQMCNVTSEFLLHIHAPKLINSKSQTARSSTCSRHSCNSHDRTSASQFWTGQVESFYCVLEECSSENKRGYPLYMHVRRRSNVAVCSYVERMVLVYLFVFILDRVLFEWIVFEGGETASFSRNSRSR
jgi:hypothetical protein